MADDNWKDRLVNMNCRTCMWYVRKIIRVDANSHNAITRFPGSPVGRSIGRCHRHAPTMSGFVPVFSDDWCGDHRLSEAAVATGVPDSLVISEDK